METSLGLIVFLSIVAIVVIALIFANRQRERVLNTLAELAVQNGWQFVRRPATNIDCILRGSTSDVSWEMKYINRHLPPGGAHADTTESLTWFSAGAKLPNGTFVAYPKVESLPPVREWGRVALGGMARTLLDHLMLAAGIDISNAAPQAAGSAAFQDRHITLAPDLETAQRLASAVEFQLLDWPSAGTTYKMPFIIVNAGGVTIRVLRTSTSVDFQRQIAERIVPLGLAAVKGAG